MLTSHPSGPDAPVARTPGSVANLLPHSGRLDRTTFQVLSVEGATPVGVRNALLRQLPVCKLVVGPRASSDARPRLLGCETPKRRGREWPGYVPGWIAGVAVGVVMDVEVWFGE